MVECLSVPDLTSLVQKSVFNAPDLVAWAKENTIEPLGHQLGLLGETEVMLFGKLARLGWMQRHEDSGFGRLNPIPLERDERLIALSGTFQVQHHGRIFTLHGPDVSGPETEAQRSYAFRDSDLVLLRNPEGVGPDPRAFYLFTPL